MLHRSHFLNNECPNCGSNCIKVEADYEFCCCRDCNTLWDSTEPDPDLNDARKHAELLERMYEADPAHWAKLVER